MEGIGNRLRSRADELGLSDSEVARRLGMSQGRYANYIKDAREPDFKTLIRICQVLDLTPDAVLGFTSTEHISDDAQRARQRIMAAMGAMGPDTLRRAAAVMEALLTEA